MCALLYGTKIIHAFPRKCLEDRIHLQHVQYQTLQLFQGGICVKFWIWSYYQWPVFAVPIYYKATARQHMPATSCSFRSTYCLWKTMQELNIVIYIQYAYAFNIIFYKVRAIIEYQPVQSSHAGFRQLQHKLVYVATWLCGYLVTCMALTFVHHWRICLYDNVAT